MLKGAWKKKDKAQTAPNVIRMIDWFNKYGPYYFVQPNRCLLYFFFIYRSLQDFILVTDSRGSYEQFERTYHGSFEDYTGMNSSTAMRKGISHSSH